MSGTAPATLLLLRGINVGGRNRVPMVELREVAEGLGWSEPRTYLQSGNLVVRARGSAGAHGEALEGAIRARFGLAIPVIAREGAAWSRYLRENPFPDESAAEPNRVMLALSRAPLAAGAAGALQERAVDGERVVGVGDALWLHFPGSVARSRLTPALLDRRAGSPVTLRNWRTVRALGEMVGAG